MLVLGENTKQASILVLGIDDLLGIHGIISQLIVLKDLEWISGVLGGNNLRLVTDVHNVWLAADII